jgi:hypothetical protein
MIILLHNSYAELSMRHMGKVYSTKGSFYFSMFQQILFLVLIAR